MTQPRDMQVELREAVIAALAPFARTAEVLGETKDAAIWAGQKPAQPITFGDLRRAARTLALLTDLASGAEGWRPIETAPRDGTDFLGVNARIGAGPYICHWQEGAGEVRDLDDDLARADDLSTWHGWMGRDFFANPRWLTHWRPLPDPPAPTTPHGKSEVG